MFTITKDRTPILFQQSPEVQRFATQFNTLYNGKKSVAERIAWGKLLEPAYQGLSENTVNAKGETLSRNKAWIAVCAELGIPRTTADHYRNEYVTSQTYPEAIREAAQEAGLNLALDYVQAAYGKMIAEGQTQTPNALEATGIVAQLESVSDPNKTAKIHKKGADRFQEMLNEAFKYAEDEELDAVTVEHVLVPALNTWAGRFKTADGWTLVTDASGHVVGANAPVL